MLHLVHMANATVDKLFAHWDAATARAEPLDVLTEIKFAFIRQFSSAAVIRCELGYGGKIYLAVSDALKLLRKRNNAVLRFPAWLPTHLNRQLAHTRTILEAHKTP